jgi:hypothetical protein
MPNRVITHPNAARNAPINFMTVGEELIAGFPSSGLIFRNPKRLTAKMITPEAKANLPRPVERYAIPTQAKVNPTRNVVKPRPCPVFAAMYTFLSAPLGALTINELLPDFSN